MKPVKAWAVYNPDSSMVPWLFEYQVEAIRFRDVIARAVGLCEHEKIPMSQVEVRSIKKGKNK